MLSVQVEIDVSQPQDEVFAFLDVMANHIGFTDHMLHDWQLSGPERGVGASATVTARAAGRTDTIRIEVTASDSPHSIVERNVGAGGRREAYGTYTLKARPGGGTRVQFDWTCRQAPLLERLLQRPIASYLRRENQRAMERLAEQLAAVTPSAGTPSA